jgi:hypothetical protein
VGRLIVKVTVNTCFMKILVVVQFGDEHGKSGYRKQFCLLSCIGVEYDLLL